MTENKRNRGKNATTPCGHITRKGTPCKLNRNNCKFHLKEKDLITTEPVKEDFTSILSVRQLYYADKTWSYNPSRDAYFCHDPNYCETTGEDCVLEEIVGEARERMCIVYCMCPGCDINTRTHIDYSRKNPHCIFCRCKSCVCTARRVNGQYCEENRYTEHTEKGICCTCSTFAQY